MKIEVLIVGAGPVGLVAACELARRGIAVRVVDAADGSSSASRAKGLQPRSLEVLDDLGVVGRIMASGRSRTPIRRYAGTTVLGTSEVNPDAHEPSSSTPYTRTMLIPQWRVEEVLRERLEELGVAVEYESRLVGLEQDGELVHATVHNAGGRENVSVPFVVGSDGASSDVRKLIGVGFLGQTDETVRMLTGDIELSGLDRDFWHWWPSADGKLLALCPLASTNTFQIQIGVSADAAEEFSQEEIQSLIDQRSGRNDIRVRRVVSQSVWRFNVRMVDRYRVGRVFLAGDSAHVHSLAGGLGMNTGIQDAYNLGWKIAHVLGGAPQALLDTYEEERLPVAAGILSLSSKLVSERLKGGVPSEERSTDTAQLNLNYPASALNDGPSRSDAIVNPGDRAPDSLGHGADGSAVRFFDLFRGQHLTVLAFGPQSRKIAEVLAERFPRALRWFAVLPADAADAGLDATSVVDHAGHAHRDYGIDGDTLLIVRPDGYIGLRVTDPDQVRALDYLSRVLPRRAG
ncbi:FAD-dependent monooxygenase [Kribbella jiaozuonensis]|uniref:3-(3-hydroxyphenyl)propionate hydroxylase n=1 Tax=Kribbella jiaozuonensis TaxID=2575441 RepID=A0A4U3M3X4_9ACTN|nr:FAD-dependent monooxygenase [Kribbella jiaozuonensis]TKK82829.1 3-(3-hydroxyphenyl)propionate hydroxylase [Kribbella jiaozuonensis]